MKTELTDMIRFWQYDGSDRFDGVQTDFFELEPDQINMTKQPTFRSYNAAIDQEGPYTLYHFGSEPSLMPDPGRIPDKVTIKHRE